MRFKIEPYDPHVAKFIEISDRDGILNLRVDYDDVDHDAVEAALPGLVQGLNFAFGEYVL